MYIRIEVYSETRRTRRGKKKVKQSKVKVGQTFAECRVGGLPKCTLESQESPSSSRIQYTYPSVEARVRNKTKPYSKLQTRFTLFSHRHRHPPFFNAKKLNLRPLAETLKNKRDVVQTQPVN